MFARFSSDSDFVHVSRFVCHPCTGHEINAKAEVAHGAVSLAHESSNVHCSYFQAGSDRQEQNVKLPSRQSYLLEHHSLVLVSEASWL